VNEFGRVVSSQTSGKAVFRYRHKNGNWRWFESTGQTVETASGELTYVIVSRDITDRRRLEEELFKAEKLESLGVLAGGDSTRLQQPPDRDTRKYFGIEDETRPER